MKNIIYSLLVSAFAFVLGPIVAQASELEIDLSEPEVELTASFDGADLLLFGIHKPNTEVIIVVRGPEIETSVRRKKRVGGIWINGDEVLFENAPTYYNIAATRTPSEILPPEILKQYQIGTDNLNLKTSSKGGHETDAAFTQGLIRNMQATELYGKTITPIKKRGEQLFRTHLWFPSNVHVGDYTVDTFLVQNRQITAESSTLIKVHKVGLEADIYNFAHDYALLYGLLAIVIALVSGWTANAVFRRG